MCASILSTALKHFSFYGEKSEILSKTYIGRYVHYPLFLSDLIKKFLNRLSKPTRVMNIRRVGAGLSHADRRTDRHGKTNK